MRCCHFNNTIKLKFHKKRTRQSNHSPWNHQKTPDEHGLWYVQVSKKDSPLGVHWPSLLSYHGARPRTCKSVKDRWIVGFKAGDFYTGYRHTTMWVMLKLDRLKVIRSKVLQNTIALSRELVVVMLRVQVPMGNTIPHVNEPGRRVTSYIQISICIITIMPDVVRRSSWKLVRFANLVRYTGFHREPRFWKRTYRTGIQPCFLSKRHVRQIVMKKSPEKEIWILSIHCREDSHIHVRYQGDQWGGTKDGSCVT